MAEADLDVVIRSIAKQQNKALMDAARKRQGWLMGLAAKATDKAAKQRHKQAARDMMQLAAAAARRLQVTAENAADSYARSIKKAAELALAAQPTKEKPKTEKSVKRKPAAKKASAKNNKR